MTARGARTGGAEVPTLHVRTVAIDEQLPLVDLLPERDGFAWVRNGEGLIASGIAHRLPVETGPERSASASEAFDAIARAAEVDDAVGLPGTGLVAFGSFTFDPAERGSVLVVPQLVVGRRGGRGWLTTIGELAPSRSTAPPPSALRVTDRVRYAGASVPDHLWMAAVAEATARIAEGHVEKVVLARDQVVWTRGTFDVRVLVRRLAEHFPTCHTFCCERLVGATPELLVRRVDDRVDSVVLAGSAGRGGDPDEDEAMGAQLRNSDKDRREHALAVSTVRRALAPRCAELRVDGAPVLLRLENVQHLATRVEGRLHRSSAGLPDALELAGALHPTAAVGGVPQHAALDLIRELEGMDRGRYSGPVGWIDDRGDGEFGIALRCAEIDGSRGRLFAGAGIVAGSLPEAELEETRLKLLAMRTAFEARSADEGGPSVSR